MPPMLSPITSTGTVCVGSSLGNARLTARVTCSTAASKLSARPGLTASTRWSLPLFLIQRATCVAPTNGSVNPPITTTGRGRLARVTCAGGRTLVVEQPTRQPQRHSVTERIMGQTRVTLRASAPRP